ncbi:MAG TPA: hypothetical protein DCM27_06430 [Rhodospirillaceae bacterium]|nr:hypothetical protein [Rhodospirillaceae bacterium]
MLFGSLVLGPINMVMRKSPESCVQFTGKENLFDRLGLEDLSSRLTSGKAIYIPENPSAETAPIADRHFPQMAVVWELEQKHAKRLQTLQLEMGAGHRFLSLTFCPLKADSFGKILQLDELIVHRGHDVYEVDLNDFKNMPAIGQILSKVQLMVAQFLSGQNDIQQLLEDVVDAVILLQPPQTDYCDDDADYHVDDNRPPSP